MAERRRHDRAEVDGCVVVHVPGGEVHGRIINLSCGGILLREVEDSSNLEIGLPVLVELELDRLGWATQAGTVVRSIEGETAIAFQRLQPELGDVISMEVTAATDAKTNPRVVVVDPSPTRRRRITDALREEGARSLEASTPLEAVDLIERSRVRVQAVAIAERTRSQTDSDELVGYLAENHPEVRLAVIGDRPANPRVGVSMLPSDEHADFRGPVRELLRRT